MTGEDEDASSTGEDLMTRPTSEQVKAYAFVVDAEADGKTSLHGSFKV